MRRAGQGAVINRAVAEPSADGALPSPANSTSMLTAAVPVASTGWLAASSPHVAAAAWSWPKPGTPMGPCRGHGHVMCRGRAARPLLLISRAVITRELRIETNPWRGGGGELRWREAY